MRDFRFELKNGDVEMELSGNLVDITEAVATVIGTIHSSFFAEFPEGAEIFRFLVTEVVKHPDTPLWSGNAIADDCTVIHARVKKR